MGKNIVVLSDGTGQRGGVLFDECRSNIYKLYRATRCGPDSQINPAEQLTYYDPGIGTAPGGLSTVGRLWRKFQNLISQATGLGLTTNIIECYAAILRMWEPGDRIFLFGFSRGAYTVRCLAAVIGFCGIPTVGADGKPLRRDVSSTRAVARVAVKKVYQHVSSPKDEPYLNQRKALSAWFKEKYRSKDEHPYFIGVFDTVASMWRLDALLLLGAIVVIAGIAVTGALWLYFGDFVRWLSIFGITVFVGVLLSLLCMNIRWAHGLLGYSFLQTVHTTSLWMQFYDDTLNQKVGYARHALAVDENRKQFQRVPWGNAKDKWRDTGKGNPPWLKQYWFAGNHSDIGGSYPENESRLSDIALDWMVQQAQEIPEGLKVDRSVLQLHPDCCGMQHDEWRSFFFRFAGKAIRAPVANAILHPSIEGRFKASGVLQYDEVRLYRPEALRDHEKVENYYKKAL